MRYYCQIPGQRQTGPWTLDDLKALYLDGAIGPNTPLESEQGRERIRFQELWQQAHGGAQGVAVLPEAPPSPEDAPGFAKQAGEDFRTLTPHLLVPWAEFKSGNWLRHRRAFLIAAVGLMPLMIIAAFGESSDLSRAYWAIALYFSVLWAAFFYHAYPAPSVNLQDAAFCFFGSALSCSLILWALYATVYTYTPAKILLPWVSSPSLLKQWVSFVFAVGLPEELCKASVLILMFQRKDDLMPHTILFYGLLAGLGFGIYEGVRYQFQLNWPYTHNIGSYYLLNVLRLTSLPFLHSVWTGIAAYFLGFALRYPERRRGLWLSAIGLPALLHGTYNTFSRSGVGVLVAVISVLVLNLYLARSMDLEKTLRSARPRPS